MGGGRVTQLGLTIVELIPDQNLMLVRGSVPGSKGDTVEVEAPGGAKTYKVRKVEWLKNDPLK